MKEALRIQMTLAEELLNQGGELQLEIPSCWVAVIWEEQLPPIFDDIQVLGTISPDDTEAFGSSSKRFSILRWQQSLFPLMHNPTEKLL